MPSRLNANTLVWAEPRSVEPQALNQIFNISKLPVIDGMAVMADCHFGKGATVGSVIASRVAVIPAAVGVDIGCGMAALQTNLTAADLPESLKDVRADIEKVVPLGPDAHEDRGNMIRGRNPKLQTQVEKHLKRYDELACRKSLSKNIGQVGSQVGTLGGGNHFIELCLDEQDGVWVMLHSGSRNVGLQIANRHIAAARKLIGKRGFDLPDQELAWLEEGEPQFDAYVADVGWAQEYARLNRMVMIHNIFKQLGRHFPHIQVVDEAIHCHHNYIAREWHKGQEMYVTRKGAVNAEEGQLGIIPGSMGTRSYIVRGKGNPEAFHSCSHGAGRRMSRGEAKRRFTTADLEAQTAGVECRKDGGVLDEIPGAYKDIDEVMALQEDLVEVVHTLKAVLCVKG